MTFKGLAKGDVTKWTSFWDSFNSAVHQNTETLNIDKFNTLHLLLDGTTAAAIQGLVLNRTNYSDAIDLLKERFGKPQNIIAAHMDELLKIPAPDKVRAISDCKNILTKAGRCSNCLRPKKALPVYMYTAVSIIVKWD